MFDDYRFPLSSMQAVLGQQGWQRGVEAELHGAVSMHNVVKVMAS